MPTDIVVKIKIKGDGQTMTRTHKIEDVAFDVSPDNEILKGMVDKAIADFKKTVKSVMVTVGFDW